MKKLLLALPLVCLCACGGAGEGSDPAAGEKGAPTAADRREAWRGSLADSVDALQVRYDECQEECERARERFATLLERFEIVNDPMLVEPYRVEKGWKNYDTTGKQGILARVLEDGTIEIVATTAGDFSSITLSSGGECVSSGSVPSGNALHATVGSLTRVAFNEAEALAAFTATHRDQPVTLTFSNGKSFALSKAQKDMIADTWTFAQTLAEINELERRESVIYNKLQLCQTKLAELDNQTDK